MSDDIFDRVKDRVCAACGGTASCGQITSARGAKTYRFTCAQCHRTFTTSGLFGLIVFAACGVFMLVCSGMILAGKSRDVAAQDTVKYGLAAIAAGLAFLAYAGYRVNTARKNPEIT